MKQQVILETKSGKGRVVIFFNVLAGMDTREGDQVVTITAGQQATISEARRREGLATTRD